MFDSLKKKLSGWFRKKEVVAEELEEEKKEKKVEKKVAEKKKKVEKVKAVVLEEQDIEEELKEKADKIKEDVPMRFEVGKLKSEPDIEAIQEKAIEEEEVDEEKGFFSKLKKKLLTSELKQADFDDIFEEFEMTLLENNVALEVVDKIKSELEKDLVGISIKKREIEETIIESLKKAIDSVLVEGDDLVEVVKKRLDLPYVILFFGINGSGKTTSVAKLASKFKKEGISCVMAAADTFRAASIEQLETHGKRVGVPVIKGQYGGDPAAVAHDAISYAKKHKTKVVLIDTAGRMYTKKNLMKEMEKIVRVSKPDLKIFVGESITGNDATEQAKMFSETAGIDGIILSKADIDEKAGAILSVSYITKKPILFLGVGQGYEDLKKFEKKEFMKGLGLE